MPTIDGKPVPAIPKRKENESAEEYVDRLEHFKRKLPSDLLNARVRGAVSIDGQIAPWQKAPVLGETSEGLSPGAVQDISGRVNPLYAPFRADIPLKPAPRRRTVAKRVQEMVDLLMEQAVDNWRKTGKVVLSQSVIARIARLTGRSPVDIEYETLEGLRNGLEAYARSLLTRAGDRRAGIVVASLEETGKTASGRDPEPKEEAPPGNDQDDTSGPGEVEVGDSP